MVDISLTNIKKLFYMQNFISMLVLFASLFTPLFSQTWTKETILIETQYGNMKIKLFEETPLHRANFIKLVNEHFFDSLLFHRVIQDFMIQGGDPLSKTAAAGDSLGHGDLGYTLPAEFNPNLIHKKGRLCAARESDAINPHKASSPSQFYLVMGKVRSPEDLKKAETRIRTTRYTECARKFIGTSEGIALKKEYNRLKTENKADSAELVNSLIESEIKKEYAKIPEYTFSAQQIETYTTVGGTPHLDGNYTVFGEVIEGLEVIDKIAALQKDARDRPLVDVRMKIALVK
jgi:cyclophilin family peptidyl-prolyl cis-trans isomerase